MSVDLPETFHQQYDLDTVEAPTLVLPRGL